MGWRHTGMFRTPQEVLVLTCDVCERDIGHEDERRPKAHYRVSRLPNLGTMDDQDPPSIVCSAACLRSFAARMSEPERSANDPINSPDGPRGKA